MSWRGRASIAQRAPRGLTPHIAVVAVVAVIAAVAAACSSTPGPAPAPAAPLFTRAQLLDPETCSQCHADHVRDWSGSMHAYASDDPVFLAMNKRGQRETNGALGSFCVSCHAPMAVRDGATKDGLNLADLPKPLKGVTCFFCHTVDTVTGAHDAALHLAEDGVIRGEYTDPVANTAHKAGYSALHDRNQADSAKMCGACHDIVNAHGANIERTFAEWQTSVFSHPGGATCGQCHMDQSATLQPIAQAPNVFARRTHSHSFQGVDIALTPFPEADAQKKKVQAFLDSTLQTALCVSARGTGADVRVIVDNVAAGHGFPSGSAQDRRLWFEVNAYKAGQLVYASGVVPDGTSPVASTDPDIWLLRDCMFDASGAQVGMFWQATTTDANALPGQLTFDPTDPRFYQTHIIQRYPRTGSGLLPTVPDRVTLRVRLQPMGLELLDDLVAGGDLDPAVRGAMPIFDIGELLEWTTDTATTSYVDQQRPVMCVTKTNLDAAADKVAAKAPARCKP